MSNITKVQKAKTAAYTALVVLGIALSSLMILLLAPPWRIREEAYTCKSIPDLPSEILFTDYGFGNSVYVNWNEPNYNPSCGVTYRIDYSIDGSERWITSELPRSPLEIRDLESCSLLKVRIRVVNKFDDVTADYIERNYTVIPRGYPVVNVEVFDTAEGVTLSWQEPPILRRCNMQYRVFLRTELGSWYSEIMYVKSMYIPWHRYCMFLEMQITSYANGRLNYYTSFSYHIKNRTLEGLERRISPEDPEELIISWKSDTHQMLCGSVYEVRYSADDPALSQFLITAKGEARFRFVYCTNAAVSINTVFYEGPIAGPSPYFDVTQYPQNITEIPGYTIDVSQENATVISWLPISTISTCNVTYRAQFTSDLGNFTYSDVISPIELSKLTYCSVLGIQLQVLIGQHQVFSLTDDILDRLHEIRNLRLVPSTEGDTLLIEWSEHTKKEICGLKYEVTYQYGSHFETYITNRSSINLDTIYCADVVIEVTAVGGDSVGLKNNITYRESPNIVGQVRNIATTTADNGTLSVSWDSPRTVSQCNIWYNVTATNDAAEERRCIGTSNCKLSLADFCPSKLMITASYLDDEAISGTPITVMYSC